MKTIFITALLFGSIAMSAQKIKPVTIGIEKVADSISVSVMTFKTTDKKCQLYYEVFDNKKQQIDNGNLEVTESEFTAWVETNKYIENLALTKLKLTRKTN
jgi:hypothetical protein